MRFIKNIFIFIQTSINKFFIDDCPNKAAATTYTTILSLVPLTAVFFSIFSGLELFNATKEKIQRYLLSQLLPDSSLADATSFYLTKFGTNTKTLGMIGLIALIASSLVLINQLESTLNAIWGKKKERALWKRIMIYYPVIISLPFLVGFSFYLTTNLQTLIKETIFFAPFIGVFLSLIAPYLMTCISLTLIYKYLPNTLVEWRSAIISGITSAILWENSKIIFTWYITKVVNYSKIYGTLSIIPIFLLYIFFSWLIIYFGAEVGSVIQNFKGQKIRKYYRVTSFTDYLTVLHLICENFYNHESKTKLSDISKTLSIPNEMVIMIVDHLVYLGFIKQGKKHFYLPALPLIEMNISTLWEEFIEKNLDTKYFDKYDNLAKYISKLSNNSKIIIKSDNLGDLVNPK